MAGWALAGNIEDEPQARLCAMVRQNRPLEKAITAKAAILDMLQRSFCSVRNCWAEAAEEQLRVTVDLLGELETVRHLYLRMLAHAHEHMSQAIADVRAMGYRVPSRSLARPAGQSGGDRGPARALKRHYCGSPIWLDDELPG